MEQQARSLFASGRNLRIFFEYVFEKSKGLELAVKTIPHDTAVPLLRCNRYSVLLLSNKFYLKGAVIEALCEYIENSTTKALTKDDWSSIVRPK